MTREEQVAHWRASKRTIVTLLAIWFLAACVAPVLLADALDRVPFLGMPLGFWFGHQGSVLVFVALVVAYVLWTNALDRRFGAFED